MRLQRGIELSSAMVRLDSFNHRFALDGSLELTGKRKICDAKSFEKQLGVFSRDLKSQMTQRLSVGSNTSTIDLEDSD